MNTDLIVKLMHNYKLSYLLFYAAENKLFDYLTEMTTAEMVCRRMNFKSDQKMRIILDLFTGVGLLIKEEESYCLHQDYVNVLDSKSKYSVIPLLCLEKYLMLHHNFYDNLVYALEQDGSDNFNNHGKEDMEDVYGQAMDNGGRFAAHHIGRAFRQLKMECPRILDIGGGIGNYSIPIVTYLKNAKVDIFERPEMEKECTENIRLHNMQESINFYSTNIIDKDIENNYDGILMSNVLHLYDTETVKLMVKKASESLLENGLLIIHDFFLEENHSEPLVPLLFTIDWMLIGANFNYSPKEMESMFKEFGLCLIEVKRFHEIPTSMLIFRKETI